MTDIQANSSAERHPYRRDGVARDVMRAAGIDFIGDRIDDTGALVAEGPTDAVVRMADIIRDNYPAGLDLLREVGVVISSE